MLRFWMIPLALLVGCVTHDDGKNPVCDCYIDTADTGTDTADTSDTSDTDTADSGDTSDTSGNDTGDTATSGA